MRKEITNEDIAILETEKAIMAEKARKYAIRNAMAYNKYLTHEWLEQKTNAELLCFVHPLERYDLQRMLF